MTKSARSPFFLLLCSTMLVGLVLINHSVIRAQTASDSSQVTRPAPSISPTTQTTLSPTPSSTSPTSPESLTLVAIPPRLGENMELTVKPGETIQEQIRVRNASNQPITVQSRPIDFVLDEDGKTPISVDQDVDNRWSLASWMTVAPAKQVISPNETAALALVIEVPADAMPGGHYAMVVHQPTSEALIAENTQDNTNQSATGINQQVGTLVYVNVEGPINEQAFIRNLSFPQLSEFGPLPYSFQVENNSDIHIQPALELSITNLFGKEVYSTPIETKNVFPLTSRDFDGTWEQIWGTGLYKATVTMGYGTQGQVATASTSFWLLPVKLIIAAVVLILTLIALIIVIRRHYLHRKENKDQKIQELEKQVKELESKEQNHG